MTVTLTMTALPAGNGGQSDCPTPSWASWWGRCYRRAGGCALRRSWSNRQNQLFRTRILVIFLTEWGKHYEIGEKIVNNLPFSLNSKMENIYPFWDIVSDPDQSASFWPSNSDHSHFDQVSVWSEEKITHPNLPNLVIICISLTLCNNIIGLWCMSWFCAW